MWKRFIVLCVVLWVAHCNLNSQNTLDEKTALSEHLRTELINGNYEKVARESYIFYKNFMKERSDRDFIIGIYSDILISDNKDEENQSFVYHRFLRKCLHNKHNLSCFESEMMIFYYGAVAFFKLSASSLEQQTAPLVHLSSYKTYNSVTRCFEYLYISHCMAMLAATNSENELSIEKEIKHWNHRFSSLQQKVEYMNSKYMVLKEMLNYICQFDIKYNNPSGMLLAKIDDNIDPIVKLPRPDELKKTIKLIKKYTKEYNRFINDNIELLPESKLDLLVYGPFDDDKKAIKKNLEFCRTSVQHMSREEFNHTSPIVYAKYMAYIQMVEVTAYYHGIPDIILGDILNTRLSYDVNTLYLKGANQYSDLRETDWKDIQARLGKNDYAVQFFSSTNGEDNWLMGYIITQDCKMPEVAYFGHSYWAENDSFDKFANMHYFKNATNIYYAGIEQQKATDPELTDIRIHRLYTLAELCLPTPTYSSNKGNHIIADIDFWDTENAAGKKGLLDSGNYWLHNFSFDKGLLKYLSETFSEPWEITAGSDFNHNTLREISKKPHNILHISSHGVFISSVNKKLERLGINEINGSLDMFRIGMALSEFNKDSLMNYISAAEIASMDLSGIDLVFLSICNSSKSKVSLWSTASMAYALHLAGVRYIIGFIGEVNEADADTFTRDFYYYIRNGESYHNAFYKAKNSIKSIDMRIDKLGNQIDDNRVRVIMWE